MFLSKFIISDIKSDLNVYHYRSDFFKALKITPYFLFLLLAIPVDVFFCIMSFPVWLVLACKRIFNGAN